jgi:hypothetical protein
MMGEIGLNETAMAGVPEYFYILLSLPIFPLAAINALLRTGLR